MADLEAAIVQARRSLDAHDFKAALKVLKPYKKSLKTKYASNVMLHQLFAEVYLEDGQLEKAYPLLTRACELDINGEQGGSEKFFILGQATGGHDGINLLFQGLENISKKSEDSATQEQSEQIVSSLLTVIEIWMTDLCMEENAESHCEELIGKAMEISGGKSPEVWSMLGSIRISQQRYREACEAFESSWRFFELKKQHLEQAIRSDEHPSHEEYAQLVQPFLSLSKMCIEMGLYELSLKILGSIRDIDEDNLESYYLEGFTLYLMCKLQLFKISHLEANVNADNIYEFNEHFEELPLDLNNESISELVQDARFALSFSAKLAQNAAAGDGFAKELFEGSCRVLLELGGPVDDNELIRVSKGDENITIDEQDFEFDNEQ